MPFLFDGINAALLVTAFVNFALGIVVYRQGAQKKVSRVYAYSIFAIIGWIVAMIFYRSASSDFALLWSLMLYISPTFIASIFLYFTYIFPTQEITQMELGKKAIVIFSINAFLILLILIPGVMITGVSINPGHEKEIYFGKLYLLYFLYITGFFFFGYYRLFRKYLLTLSRLEKAQIIYLVVGYLIASNLAFITNLTLPWLGYFELNWIGQIFTFFIVAFTAYAIIVHRLLDIRLITRKYIVFAASFITILLPSWFVQYFLKQLFTLNSIIVDVLVLGFAASFFPSLKSFYYDFANKYLFSSLYDSKKVIRSLSDKLRSTIEIRAIYQSISDTLVAAFHSKQVTVRIFDEEKRGFCSAYATSGAPKDFHQVGKDFIAYFVKNNAPCQTADLVNAFPRDAFLKKLSMDGVEVIAPLTIKDKIVGAILLAQKETREAYNEEDMQVLNVVGAQAAIAIENALLYEETLAFNETLKKKIDAATKKLQLQNEELQKLDKLKSEFISVISHQLRTPLTASRWALESLAKGQKGKLTVQEKETVTDLQSTNNRLIKQVNELLNVSRIEEGRIRIDPQPLDLVPIIKSIVHEFMPIAEKMKLTVVEKYAKLPPINLDEGVITKALHNFISNGIKYNTPGKKLEVTLKKDGANALLIVKDQGIGIPEAEQKNIFQRFYRASNASTSETEGTGLGMYIAKSAIEISGGKVWFESAPGKGTTFYVSLPLAGSKAQKGEKSLA